MTSTVLIATAAQLREHRRAEVERFLAFLLVVLAANNHQLPHHLNVGTIVAVVSLPVWIPALQRYRGGATIMIAAVAAVVSGVLTAAARAPYHGFDSDMAFTRLFELTALMGILGVTLWARSRLDSALVGLAFGIGMLGDIKLHAGTALAATSADAWNIWKFELALPLAIIGLSLAWMRRSHTLEVIVPIGLAAVSSLNDARSSFGLLLLTAVLAAMMTKTFREKVARNRRRRRPWLVGTALLGLVAAVVYRLGEAFIVSGGLGAAAQARSLAQLNASGSLLLGGRPEAFATLALAKHFPMGFGLGIPARLSDITIAKTGMARLGYDPNNGYVERYMFGGQIELHSFIGDMWSAFGIGGLAMVLYLLILVIRPTARLVRARSAPALVIHLALQSVWAIFFSPVSSALVVALMVAITLDERRSQRSYST